MSGSCLGKMKTKKRHKKRETSPGTMLAEELDALRRDLRATVRAYAARLEIDLAESIAAIRFVERSRNVVA